MDHFNVDDASAHKFSLALDLFGSSSQVSQPTASLETRLENLSLTAPACTPEVSALRASLPPDPVLQVYRSLQKTLHAREFRRQKGSTPFYLNLWQERLAQTKKKVCARISQDDMGSTSCISSSTASDHEMNDAEKVHENFYQAVVGSPSPIASSPEANHKWSISTKQVIFEHPVASPLEKDLEMSGRDGIGSETTHQFSVTHFWCLECRQCKPRKKGIMCLCLDGNFLCQDCDIERKKPEPAPPRFNKDWARAHPLCFACGIILPYDWRKSLFLCERCKLAMERLKAEQRKHAAKLGT